MKKFTGIPAAVCLLLMVTGCFSTSSLVNSWGDPSIKKPQIRKMLVLAINQEPAIRRIWEDDFVNELNKHGLTATASYRLLKDAVPNSNQVQEAVKANGFDAILVTHRLPIVATTNVTPDYTTLEPDYTVNENQMINHEFWPERYRHDYSYIQYWPSYYTHYSQVTHYGTTEIDKYHMKQITLWTTGTSGRIIWSATSKSGEPETDSPDSAEKIRLDVVNLVIPDLVQHNIIKAE